VTNLSDFKHIVFADFEFVSRPGEHPDVVCLAWHHAGRTHVLRHDQLGAEPPYPTGDDTLFVCFVFNAEGACHLSRDWPLPAHVLDLSAEFRRIVNGRTVAAGRGLLGALAYYGLPSIGAKQKEAVRDLIQRGFPFTPAERETILRYAVSDVDPSMVQLLPLMLPDIGDLDQALFRGEFVTASARMEHRGVPIDGEIFNELADKGTWTEVRDAMVPAIDAAYSVYVKDAGGWHFNTERFAAYLRREGISWPATETGKLSLRGKTFETMTKGHPQMENLRQLRHALNKMRRIQLAVGKDGRNRSVLWPFKSKTGRTQPKAREWIFSPAVWLRRLIRPGPGMAIAYIDWGSMEFLIAAALSGDPVMREFYRSDPYLEFPKRVGVAPKDASKGTHDALRDRYKVAMLAAQYGISTTGLAARLSIFDFTAHEMLAQHREIFSAYWAWAHDWLARALDAGTMRTVFGWSCATGITEFNERSIMNWPVQATGADILRLAVVWATRHGLRLLAPVHDAILLEAPLDRIEHDVALLQEIMRRASRVILNDTAAGDLVLRTKADIYRYPDRYEDSRGEAIWVRVLELLAERRRRHEQEAAHG
jgi:DNA polymerase-1